MPPRTHLVPGGEQGLLSIRSSDMIRSGRLPIPHPLLNPYHTWRILRAVLFRRHMPLSTPCLARLAVLPGLPVPVSVDSPVPWYCTRQGLSRLVRVVGRTLSTFARSKFLLGLGTTRTSPDAVPVTSPSHLPPRPRQDPILLSPTAQGTIALLPSHLTPPTKNSNLH